MTTRIAVTALAVPAVVVVAVLLLVLGGTSAPADRADTLVPADALVYVHVSTDPDRGQDAELLKRLQRFPAFATLRKRVKDAIGPRTGAFDFKRDVGSWLGREAAIAITPRGLLILLAVAKRPTAEGVLRRIAGGKAATRHAGVVVRRYGAGAAAFVGGFLAIGPEPVVDQVIDLQAPKSRERPLSLLPEYARAAKLRPEDRALDGWAAPGAARLALPARFARLVGARPVSLSAAPTDKGLHVEAVRLGGASKRSEFGPKLLERVPDDVLAYVGVRGLRALGTLLPAAAGKAAGGLRRGLAPLLATLDGEVAIFITPAAPEPVVTLAARTGDPSAARAALAGLQGVIAGLLVGSEDATGQVPTFEERDLGGGLDGYALTLAGGGELVYAVSGDRVIVSNADAGVRRTVDGGSSVRDAEDFQTTVPGLPDAAEAIAFIVPSQLLALGDQVGLDAGTAYRSVRDEFRKVRAVGATVRRQGNDTIAELNFLFP